mgnify:FL=1
MLFRSIGECEYQFHGANRLGANSLVACIFSGLTVAPAVANALSALPGGPAEQQPAALFESATQEHQARYKQLLARGSDGPNPYALHLELGRTMTEAATVVRRNDQLRSAYARVNELAEQTRRCGAADGGAWLNQNVVFVRTLEDMFPLARAILAGALARDECRGAHFKPQFAMPDIQATDPVQRRREAEAWCDRFEENNRRWLKSTIATCTADGEPKLTYADVNTSVIPPRPRLYGVVGGDVIEEVWSQRQRRREASPNPEPLTAP